MAKAIEEADDQLLDEAETARIELVRTGDFRAVRYVLNCKGRKRGWGDRRDRQEIANADAERTNPVLLYPAEGVMARMRNPPDEHQMNELACDSSEA